MSSRGVSVIHRRSALAHHVRLAATDEETAAGTPQPTGHRPSVDDTVPTARASRTARDSPEPSGAAAWAVAIRPFTNRMATHYRDLEPATLVWKPPGSSNSCRSDEQQRRRSRRSRAPLGLNLRVLRELRVLLFVVPWFSCSSFDREAASSRTRLWVAADWSCARGDLLDCGRAYR
jgi:hypothetical protein